LNGIAGHLVAVEADLAAGLPGTTVIGMGDAAVTQARDRIRAAVVNSGHRWPDRRITLALSPAALPKRGAGYDIALAVAVLAAAGVVPTAAGDTVLIGELGLDGQVRPVRGVLPALLAARAAGRERAIVPVANLAEAALAAGMSVWGVQSLGDLIASLTGEVHRLMPGVPAPPVTADTGPDLADVLGQPEARLALEFAAAGGHHLAMVGPPESDRSDNVDRCPVPSLAQSSTFGYPSLTSVRPASTGSGLI
jgi:magnesium chelatase family protein